VVVVSEQDVQSEEVDVGGADLVAADDPPRWPPGNYARLSAVVPGLGQIFQGRPLTALIQFATVAAYIVTTIRVGGPRATLLALFWNLWSSIDAYRHERR
jgi:hypothetical protein